MLLKNQIRPTNPTNVCLSKYCVPQNLTPRLQHFPTPFTTLHCRTLKWSLAPCLRLPAPRGNYFVLSFTLRTTSYGLPHTSLLSPHLFGSAYGSNLSGRISCKRVVTVSWIFYTYFGQVVTGGRSSRSKRRSSVVVSEVVVQKYQKCSSMCSGMNSSAVVVVGLVQ